MERALRILAALFATAAALQFVACIYLAMHVVAEFRPLLADHKQAAVLGLFLGYGVMFLLIYTQAARLVWRKTHWNKVILLSVAACLGFPVGPMLGIAALILLTRPTVRARFI